MTDVLDGIPDYRDHLHTERCTCEIPERPTLASLRPLNAGCTATGSKPSGGYVCPRLDKLRRKLMPIERAREAALAKREAAA